ncbi:MAG: hypothetical protein V9G10_08515 [Candidatus Nanopelagicales bacterium]
MAVPGVRRLEVQRRHPLRPAGQRLRARSSATASGTSTRRSPTRTACGSTARSRSPRRWSPRAKENGANIGRCRIIELQPNSYADALYNSHQDDNNRLNPDGEGYVVRCFMQLTDDKDTYMVLREDINDPSHRGADPRCRAGAQVVVDSERLWHSVWHHGDEPRYCLITSYESGPELEKWMWENNPRFEVNDIELDDEFAKEAELEAHERRDARTAYYGYDPTAVKSEA